MADLQKHLEKAEKYVSKNKLEPAIQEYKAALELAPHNHELLRTIADLYARAGKGAEATRHYAELFDKYAEKNDATKGVALFRRSLQDSQQPPERYFKLALLLQRSRKNSEAVEAYRTALDLFQKAGNAAGILDCLEHLAALEPENADTQVQLGEQANKMGKADVAAKAFLRAGQLLRPDDIYRSLELLHRAYDLSPERSTALNLAQVYQDKGNHAQAAELLLPLYAETDQDPTVLETLGSALLAAKRLPEAEEVLELFYQASPDSFDKLFELADLYCQAGQASKGVALLTRVKQRFFDHKRDREFIDRLESIYKSNQAVIPLVEFAATSFNEVNQESRYATALGTLFDLYHQARDYGKAADALERLIEIDPYDFENQKRLEKLQGKLDEARLRAVSSRIASAATITGQAATYAPPEEKPEQIPTGDPRQMQALLEDLIVQIEIFLQYSLKAKAIEKLQKIQQLFPGEESRNERLYKLYEQAQYFPEGFGAPPPPGGAPPAGPPAAAVPPPAGTAAVNHLAKISEITHTLYRQSTPKTVLYTAVSEVGKYLHASRCVGVLGRPGTPPSTAVEFCAPGVPQSPSAAIVKLLGLLSQVNLDPENGAVLDASLSPELKQVEAQSVLAMPLIDKEKQEPVGLIALTQADCPRQWKPDEVYLLRAVADQAETAISHTKLRSLMKTLSVADAGTGLLGRGSYLDCMVSEVIRAKAQGTPLVLLLLELDRSGQLMQQMGEAEMHKFMQRVGETLLASVRQNDIAIRYTATSLAVVLGDTTAEKVQPVVNKLRAKLSAVPLPGGKDSVSFSAGVSEAAIRPDYDPLDIVTDVINRAEFSLEEARKKGNAVVIQ